MNENEIEITDPKVNDVVYLVRTGDKCVIKDINHLQNNVVYYKVSSLLGVKWINMLRFGMFVDKKMSFLCKTIRLY